jgi:glycosyltransferase involved in cell wall biosynthesis
MKANTGAVAVTATSGSRSQYAGHEATAVPFVTVIVPCRNEVRYIARCLDSILENGYPRDRFEVLVVDGRSDDGTREILDAHAARHPAIRVLDNPKRITPTALNIAVRAARGDVIMRMDAHVVYPDAYIPRLVEALYTSGADNVGGVIETLPADGTATAKAIALALSHPFGVGNSYFRVGTREPRWTDAVAFGCYRRQVFERIGLFDEELVRNQDDEFDLRLIRRGGRVLLLPDVIASYFARKSRRQLARMYFQYGYFKPLVAKKLGKVMTGRQLVPALFMLALAASAVASLASVTARILLAALVGAYATATIGCSLSIARRHGVRCGLTLISVFPCLHFSYGVGYLRGLHDHVMRPGARARAGRAMPLSR